MCNDKKLSKFQRKVVSQLKTMLMPYDINFEYSKSSKNHLKVVVEGVEKPLYTSSTPSDHRAFEQFKGEVRKRIRTLTSPKREELKRKSEALKDEKIQQSNVLELVEQRITQLSSLLAQSEENKLIRLGLSSFDTIRTELALDQIDKVAGELDIYLDDKSLGIMVKKVIKLLNNVLPSKINYTDSMLHNIDEEEVIPLTEEPHNRDSTSAEQTAINAQQYQQEQQEQQEHNTNKTINSWLTRSTPSRVQELRSLSKLQAQQLIQDIEAAQTQNHEASINEILDDVIDKDVDISVLIERLTTLT